MSSRSHLKLIYNRNSSIGVKYKKPIQLEFSYPDENRIILIQTENLERSNFTLWLNHFQPRCLIDTRAAPRFDTILGSRSDAFSAFDNYRLTYIDLLGRIGANNYSNAEINPAFWSDVIVSMIEARNIKGSYMFLFDNCNLRNAAERPLVEAFTRLLDSKISMSIVP